MPIFNNIKDLHNKLLNDSANIFENKIGKNMVNVVKEHIESDVYSYKPDEYERTNELKDSVINTPAIITNNTIEMEITHDTDLINSYVPNQHMSVLNGDDISDNIPYIVHEGLAGKIFGEGVWTEPRPYMDNAKEEIIEKNQHIKDFKEGLKNKGYKVD